MQKFIPNKSGGRFKKTFLLPLLTAVFIILFPGVVSANCYDVSSTGSYFEAEDFTGTMNQGNGTFLAESSRSGYLGNGYLRTSNSDFSSCPSNDQGKEYQLNFPEAGIYAIWIRSYAPAGPENSITIGADGNCLGVIQSTVYNQWVWTDSLQQGTGTNKINIQTPGVHKINIWARENNFLTDAIYLTKGSETPTDSVVIAKKIVPGVVCGGEEEPEVPMQRLQVSTNKHFLVKEDGTPFFWMGDTAWSLATVSREDVTYYMTNRAQSGFNLIHVDADAYAATNFYGQRPFVGENPDNRNEAWWQHIDHIINEAEANGLYVCIFPMWGSVVNNGTFSGGYLRFSGNATRAYNFGKWIGSRYKDKTNVIWSVAGEYESINSYNIDTFTAAQKALFDKVAQGVRDAGATQVMTIHAGGSSTSSRNFHSSSWLDFNMVQRGYYVGANVVDPEKTIYAVITKDYNLTPTNPKPVVYGEGFYEEFTKSTWTHRINATDVRMQAYWSVFLGALGTTYGHMSVQTMNNPLERYSIITPWKEALNAAGGQQMKYLRNLMESFSNSSYLTRIPDQTIVTSPSPIPTGDAYIQATRDSNGTYALVYIPNGATVTVNMAKITGGNVDAYWYDPRTGENPVIGNFPNIGTKAFDAPGTPAVGNDWVLVLKKNGASGCTSFTYSPWTPSVCPQNQTQTRTITSSSPQGCTGGTPESLTKSCIYQRVYTLSDFKTLLSQWLQSGSSDINNDSIVNTRDLGIMMSNWSN